MDRRFPAPAATAWRPPAGEAIPIENEILALYTRSYTELMPFQRAGCTEYILLGRPLGPLRVIVRAQRAGEANARVAQCELGTMEEAAARRLLQFLYENAVSVENAGDLVQDLYSTAGVEVPEKDAGTAALL